jgi:hypothetical protein
MNSVGRGGGGHMCQINVPSICTHDSSNIGLLLLLLLLLFVEIVEIFPPKISLFFFFQTTKICEGKK